MKRMNLAIAGGDGSGDDPFYTSKWWIASGVFLLLTLMMCGVVFAFTGSGGATVTPKGVPAVNTGGSVCGLPAGSQDPVVGPPYAKWTLVGTIAAPSAPDIGPGVLNGHDRRCFAHSPIGALFAAANVAAMISLPPGALSVEDGLRHVVPSRTREIYSKQPSAPVDPSIRFQIAGFQVGVLGHDDVNVTLALQSNINEGAMVAWTLPMHWMAGDWRVRLGSVEEPFIGAPLRSLGGFVEWGGA
jgi:hypothetical protein